MPPLNYFNYYTEIEEHFGKCRAKHLVLSPLDWSLIEVWRDSGVPLNIVLRGIDRAFESFRARANQGRRVNRLFYCHAAVMEAFAEYKEAMVGSHPGELGGASDAAVRPPAAEPDARGELTRWFARTIAQLEQGRGPVAAEGRPGSVEALDRVRTRLHELSLEVEARQDPTLPYEAIERDLAALNQVLLDAARQEVPEETLSEWHTEAKKALKVYRQNLEKETYERILENYLNKRLQQHFSLPPLTLFAL